MSTDAPAEQGAWERTVRGGRPRRLGLRVLVALLALVVVVAAIAFGAALRASSAMAEVPVEGLASRSDPLHILVVGSDSRAGLSEQERIELTTGDAAGERTDTIFVMTIGGGDVALLAFPRDLYVTRCDGSEGRINAAMSIGGPGCLVTTIRDLSGIPISHFMQVNFAGFRDLVDAVGGVRLCLERPIQDAAAGIDLPAGCQTLTGAQALGYVRVRKIDNDLERIERQQAFLKALAQEVVSPSTVINVPRMYHVAGAVGGALTVDAGFGPIDVIRLGWAARGLASGASVTETVPVRGTAVGGAAVLLPIEEEAAPLFAAFRDGSILGRATDLPPPSEVEVAVLNGAGVAGLAGRTAEALRAGGFRVVDVADADQPVEATVIRYPPGAEPAARTLAGSLPSEPQLEQTDAVATVTLVLGPDAAG